jgi:hypothetical protein
VTNTGSDRSQLANIASQAKDVLGADHLDVVADRGYFNSPEILACEQADITVTMPKPMTSGAKSDGRFGKQDFVYLPAEDVYRCPAGEKLIMTYRYTNEEDGKALRRYWTTACPNCPLKSQCTKGPERRITRWEHEHVLEAVQQRLDKNPQAMRVRRETVEHPFGTIKMRMGATHFLMKTLPRVASEMALCVLAYNLTRVMNIVGIKPLMAAIRA